MSSIPILQMRKAGEITELVEIQLLSPSGMMPVVILNYARCVWYRVRSISRYACQNIVARYGGSHL